MWTDMGMDMRCDSRIYQAGVLKTLILLCWVVAVWVGGWTIGGDFDSLVCCQVSFPKFLHHTVAIILWKIKRKIAIWL